MTQKGQPHQVGHTARERRFVMALMATLVTGVVILSSVVVTRSPRPHVLSGQVQTENLALPRPVSTDAYRGLAHWIDVYDYAPSYEAGNQAPPIEPAALRTIAATGARTLFLQTAGARTPGPLENTELLGRFLAAAHGAGVRVVGWYVPTLVDVDADLEHLIAVTRFRHESHRFDGLAVDIESTQVPDPVTRTARLADLSRRLRQAVGAEYPLGAIVPPPVLLEDVNPELWPGFPWRGLRDFYDVWIPMIYWTLRSPSSRYDDPARYTAQTVKRLLLALDQPGADVHVVGGVADEATEDDYRTFAAAARDVGAIGLSIYDFRSLSGGGLAVLSRTARSAGPRERDLRE